MSYGPERPEISHNPPAHPTEKSKYIPVTHESFARSHYKGGADVVAHYLSLYPDSRIFSGKSFILGGSFANELNLRAGVKVGDLSANLIENINPVANLFRIPSKQVALLEDWSVNSRLGQDCSGHEHNQHIRSPVVVSNRPETDYHTGRSLKHP